MKVCVTTSNNYLHLIPVFCFLFNKNWSPEQQVEIVGYDKPDYELPENFTFHSLGEQIGGPTNFSTDLRKYFEKQDDWVIWCMDDTFILSVDHEKLDLVKTFTQASVGRINLCSRATKLQDHFESVYLGHTVLENTQTAEYRLATQPSIWKKEFLLKYMTPNLSCWDFESQPSFNDGYRILGLKEEIIKHNEGVTKHDIYKLNLNGVLPQHIEEMEDLGILTDKMKYTHNKSTRDRILDKYLKVCMEASENDQVFTTFKSHPDYHEVLEHCPKKIGQAHLDNIRENNEWLLGIQSIWYNDHIGSPKTERYEGITASPTTLQYVSVLSNLIKTFGSLQGLKICELGCGYGGQAKIIQDCFGIESYDIIDLYEVTLLVERYLKDYKVKTYTNENYEVKEWDIFISNYALTEVSATDQLKYVQDICLNSKMGYITANQPLNGIDLIKEKFNVTISPDIKGERETNYLITWK